MSINARSLANFTLNTGVSTSTFVSQRQNNIFQSSKRIKGNTEGTWGEEEEKVFQNTYLVYNSWQADHQ